MVSRPIGALELAEELAHGGGALRAVAARLAARIRETKAWWALGHARADDYAREELGCSGRQFYDLAQTGTCLVSRPAIESALISGEIGWTRARLLARNTEVGEEEAWLVRSAGWTTAELSRAVRAGDRFARTGAPPSSRRRSLQKGSGRDRETVALPDAPGARALFYEARALARRVAGAHLDDAAVLEAVVAEGLSGLDLELQLASDETPLDATAGLAPDLASATGLLRGGASPDESPAGADLGRASREGATSRSACAHDPWGSEVTRALWTRLPVFLRPLVQGLETADAHDLDERIRRALRLEQVQSARIGPVLLRISQDRAFRTLGYFRMAQYASERLGLCGRSVEALLRIERACASSAELERAYREGELSSEQAERVARVVLAFDAKLEPEMAARWVEHARRVTVLELEDDVDRALATGLLDPAVFATRESWHEAEPADHPQIGAHPSAAEVGGEAGADVGGEAGGNADGNGDGCGHLRLGTGVGAVVDGVPREVARLFRAALSALQRQIERREGRASSPAEAYMVLLQHAIDTWRAYIEEHPRRHAVFLRDGFRCTVPGCTSYRELHDHHVEFRAHGGTNDLANRTSVCAYHHLRGIHVGLIGCTGEAPHGLTWTRAQGRSAARRSSASSVFP